MRQSLQDLATMLLVACCLFVPFVGLRLGENGLTFHWIEAAACIAASLALRVAGQLVYRRFNWRQGRARTSIRVGNYLPGAMILAALVFPLLPFAGREAIDLATLIMIYATLAAALNITVGYTGLLDLGFIAFFAIGAYTYGILSTQHGIGFWECLPLTALVPALVSLVIGLAVLRLRGDYFAIVTLGFLQITNTLLVNWQGLTNGSQGIDAIPRPTLPGFTFEDPIQRIVFLYFLALILLVTVNLLCARLRRLPLGRAWDAVREDEIAAAACGISRAPVKLAAYAISAAIAGLTGAVFAVRQSFISPESFTFTESTIVLAIVVLGGAGNQAGVIAAALLLVGLPEAFRAFSEYRMLVFGAAMVVIMLVRPHGLASLRTPSLRLAKR